MIMALWVIRILFLSLCSVGGWAISQVRPEFISGRFGGILGMVIGFGFGWLMKNVLHNDRLAAVEIGGGLMILAALICFFFIKENKDVNEIETAKLEIEGERSV